MKARIVSYPYQILRVQPSSSKPIVVKYMVLVILALAPATRGLAQCSMLGRIIEPRLLRVTDEMREYIRSDSFPAASRDEGSELRHIDMLFEKGMEISRNNVNTALLAISIAVLNRTSFEPKFPMIGRVRIPLPAEDSTDAASRIRKLPRYFFGDSPKDKWGDSAKLVHFFGSAYLTYVTGARIIPDEVGVWIEEGETAFRLDSLDQKRDVFINRLGQRFGQALSEGRNVLPSDFLRSSFEGK